MRKTTADNAVSARKPATNYEAFHMITRDGSTIFEGPMRDHAWESLVLELESEDPESIIVVERGHGRHQRTIYKTKEQND